MLLVGVAGVWIVRPGRTSAANQAEVGRPATSPVVPLVEIEPLIERTARIEVARDKEEPPAVELAAEVTVTPPVTPEPVEQKAPEPISPEPPETAAVHEVELSAPIEPIYETTAVVAPPLEPARLAFIVKSSIKNGDLTIFVDGEEIYTATLVSESKGIVRIAKKAVNRGRQDLESTFDVPPGEHTITARLYSATKDKVYEDRAELAVEPGEQLRVRIVAGRAFGNKLAIKLDD